MRALVDSSVLIAAARPRESLHATAADALQSHAAGGIGVPATVLGETMSFLGARVGVDAQRSFWDAFLRSGIEIIQADIELLEIAREIDRRYSDAKFGFADCALLAACERVRCARILSFDCRLASYRPTFAPAIELLP
ncbi:MAG: PIN domain-containing protein [Actinobacteria bacterium]|nr:PIN domain-containing protein [Actinomycetota bacterium]MCG2808356.1 PIN domain-containing protein [Coriobacteriia bacterium]